MSTTIDQQVVEMRFDNKHFENNVQTSLSTLDKLKQKLRFDGASKGLENVGTAARSVDMTGLSSGVETVQAKFSALQVIGVTALSNITNSAVNAGKKMLSALTIDPIKTGLQEYETQINAVQTILANTQSKGTDIDDVNKALEELNKYADMTIYNFTEMTRNIGTFTAAGVDLDTSTNAIKGIANLAAVSGSTSQQASTAMYQLSQALASGTVKLMDWNSVVNAGMGGQVFQDALKETARVHGVAIDEMIESEGSFRETLKNEWLTADILTETLQKFTLTTEGLTETQIEANREMLRTKGYTEEQIDEIFKLGNTATEAATKVKTFTQLWDVLKEAAQSGWAQTWKLIIGDYEEAKELLSPIADILTSIINKMSDWRNAIVESALGKSFSDISDRLRGALDAISKTTDTVKGAVRAVSDLGDIVNRVIRGEFGNGIDRFNALTAAGYNHYRVQNKVNETLGDSFRHTQEVIDAQDRLLGIQIDSNEATSEAVKNTEKLNTADTLTLLTLMKLSDEQLREKKLTEDQIAALRELESISKKLGIPLAELIDNIDAIDGRWLFWESFKNIGRSIGDVFGAIKKAWDGVFGDTLTTDKLGDSLFNIIAGFHKFTRSLRLSDEQLDNLTRTFKGVFALIQMVSTVMGGAFKFAFEVISKVLQYMNLDILSVTAVIGDAIVGFRDWARSLVSIDPIIEAIVPHIITIATAIGDFFEKLKNSERLAAFAAKMKEVIAIIGNWIANIDLTPFFEKVTPYITMATDAIGRFFNAVKNSEFLAILVGRIRETVTSIIEWISGIKDAENVTDYIAQGLVNGLKNGAVGAFNAAIDLAKALWEGFCEFMGIHSPSTLMMEGGEYAAEGAAIGLQNGSSGIMEVLKTIASKMLGFVKNIDFGTIFAGGSIFGGLLIGNKLGNAAENFTAPMEGVGDVLTRFSKKLPKLMNSVSKVVTQFAKVTKSFSKVLNGVANTLNAVAFQIGAKALLNVAFAIAVLVGSIALLTLLPQGKVWSSVGVIAVLGVVLAAFVFALSKLNIGEGVKLGTFAIALVGIAGSLLIIGLAMKLIAGMSDEDLIRGGIVVLALAGIITGLMAATKLFGKDATKIGATLIGISVAMYLLLGIIKLASMMEQDALIKGGLVVLGLSAIITGLMAATKLFGKDATKIGATILGVSVAMLLLLGVVQLASMMEQNALIKGGLVVLALGGIIVGLMAATRLFAKDAGKIGATLLGISVAMLVMAMVVKICGSMDWESLGKGVLAVAAFGGIIVGLMAATKLIGPNADKISKTILTMSVAIGILAMIATLLGFIPLEHLAKGIIAVGLLSGMMTAMIWATRGANDCMNNLIVMTVAIGVMAAAVAVLSTLDPTGVAVAAGAMGLVMGMFALMIKMTGSAKKAMGTLIVLTVAIAAIGGILYLLSQLPIKSVISTAISLSVLLLALSVSLVILSAVGSSAGNALAGVILLSLMAVPLALFVGVIALMSCVKDAEANILALVAMATALTALLAVLTIISVFALNALVGLGLLTLMAVPLALFVGIVAMISKVQEAEANIKLLLTLMTALTGMMIVLALVGPMALIGVIALSALSALMIGMGTFAVGVGALMEKFPSLEKFLNTGLPVLEQLALSLGTMISNFGVGLTSGLPQIGENLSAFADNAALFMEGMKLADERTLAGIGILTAAIIALSAADVIESFATWLSGGTSFVELGTMLSQFIVKALPFLVVASQIDPAMMEGVKALVETLLLLTGANLIEGIASWLTGGSSIGTFAEQLPLLGKGLRSFIDELGTFDESTVTTVTCAANAIKVLAEAAGELPNEGGWLGKIVGENNIGAFGESLTSLGSNLLGFVESLGTFDEDKVNTVTCAANAIKVLSEAASELPNEGGWLGKIVGDNSIETFGGYLPGLGTNLSGFATNLGTFDDDKVATITCAANAIKAIADVASELPNEGGWLAKIVGDNTIETFGGYLPGLGASLSGFATNLGTFGEDKIATVTSAVKAISAFSDLADADLKGVNKNISGFGDNLGTFATDISTFASNLPAGDTIIAAVGKVRKILSMLKSLLDVDPEGAANFKDAINDLGDAGVDSFVDAFTSSTAKEAVKTAAKDLMDQAIDGIDDKKKAIETSGKEAAGEAIDGFDARIDDQYDGAEQAGKDFGNGLVKGIDSKQTEVYNAGYRLGKKAVEGEKDGQQSNSPSKLTIQAGKWLGEGLVVGMDKIGGSVYKAGKTLGATSTKGISSAISRISDVVNTDIDAQPTIRPVLDLSNVKSGASAISGMFKSNPIGVTANVGAINSMMNRRSQNGENNELVAAIDKLNRNIGKTGNTYNSIGGITYDDGSAVSDAVKVLVRAAKVEGRV